MLLGQSVAPRRPAGSRVARLVDADTPRGRPRAGGPDADGQPVRLARPGRDRVQAQPATARLPVLLEPALPQGLVELPAGATVAADEQHARIPARVEQALLLAGRDDPDP